ncbi:MAG: glycosyltransferase [Flavobacteriales bacterium]|nr:glycosyltransferase [Flavobacteriales bacterium]
MIWIYFFALLIWALVFFWIDKGVSASERVGTSDPSDEPESFAILIAVRNEEELIQFCLASIEGQEWLPKNTTVYIVDDHSADETAKVIEDFSRTSKLSIQVLPLLEGVGKKAAIRHGLSRISEELLYLCDGDVLLQKGTIINMFRTLQQSNCSVAFGPVVYEEEGLLTKVLAAENLNTQLVSEAFLNHGNALMVNGANMMIQGSMKGRFAATLESRLASGDDVFFAQSLSQNEYVSGYYREHAVIARFPKTSAMFFAQRVRWASKSSNYSKFINRGFAGLIFGLNLVSVSVWLLLPFIDGHFWLFLFLFGKWLVEFSFHRKWFHKYAFHHSPLSSIILTICYPLYVSIIGAASIIGIGFNWKGRTYKM